MGRQKIIQTASRQPTRALLEELFCGAVQIPDPVFLIDRKHRKGQCCQQTERIEIGLVFRFAPRCRLHHAAVGIQRPSKKPDISDIT